MDRNNLMDGNNAPISPAAFRADTVIEPLAFEPAQPGPSKKTIRIRIGSIIISVFLILFVIAAWFILTAKAVYIQTEPIEAAVEIRGGLQLKLADRYLLRAGEYQLNVTATGYYPIAQPLLISDQQNQQYAFKLQRLPGHLLLDSGSITRAEVFIDDEARGFTPVTVKNLAYGEHKVKIIADRYFPFEDTILIEGMDREQSLKIKLVPAWADVTISSKPEAADIFLDDVLIGQTPLTTEILQGTHAIRIKLSGHKDWQDKINIVANEAMTLPVVTLFPADAVVHLETRPAGANTTVDGEYKGQTPVELALTPGKTVEISLYKEGFQAAHRKLTVKSGDNKRLQIDLQPELTPVAVVADPPDAMLYIDGKPVGQAKQVFQLSTRPHRIDIRKPGYVDYQTTITPRLGIPQQISVKLKTLREARLESIKPLIKTATGQTLKLLRPTGFTMGASRREPGRRANESIRQVNLTRPFYLALQETTNAEYKLFDRNHASGNVKGVSLDGDKQPVVRVTWEQAALYCNWLSQHESLPPFYLVKGGKVIGVNPRATGYRLPTEAEWAWAARVSGPGKLLKFPWGDQLPPAARSGNFADDSAAALIGRIIPGYNDGYAVTAPVGSFPANDKGIFDLGGNVSEWIHDFYDIAIGQDVETDPLGPNQGEHHVIRDSSWAHGTITELRLSYRDYGNEARDDVGFRIARYLE